MEVQDTVPLVSAMLRSRVEEGETSETEAEVVTSSLKTLSKSQLRAYAKFGELVRAGKVTEEEQEQVANLLISATLVTGQDRKAPRIPSFDQIEAILEPGKLESLERAYRNSFDADGKFDPSRPGAMGEWIQGSLKYKISPEVAGLAYDMLSEKARQALNGQGSPPPGRAFGGYDENGNPVFVKGSNRSRGVFLAQRFMEQGGLSPYTGRRINIFNAEPEHMVASAHVSARAGSADQPLNLMWADPTENNSKGGTIAKDDFGLWRKQLLAIQREGREKYQTKYDKAVARSLSSKGKAATAPTDLGRALSEASMEERVASLSALLKAYGPGNSKYLIRAAGFESEAWNKQIPGTGRPSRVPMDAPFLKISIGGKQLKPSEAVLLTLATLEPSQRQDFTRAVDTLRKKRQMSEEEANTYTGTNDPRYIKRMEELAADFQSGISYLVSQFSPDLSNYL